MRQNQLSRIEYTDKTIKCTTTICQRLTARWPMTFCWPISRPQWVCNITKLDWCGNHSLVVFRSILIYTHQINRLPSNVWHYVITSNSVKLFTKQTSGHAQQISPRTHCRVLPPGEINIMSPMPLLIYLDSLVTVAETVFSYCHNGNKDRNVVIHATKNKYLAAIARRKQNVRYRHYYHI